MLFLLKHCCTFVIYNSERKKTKKTMKHLFVIILGLIFFNSKGQDLNDKDVKDFSHHIIEEMYSHLNLFDDDTIIYDDINEYFIHQIENIGHHKNWKKEKVEYELDWAYTNYNCLNFFTNSLLPNGSPCILLNCKNSNF